MVDKIENKSKSEVIDDYVFDKDDVFIDGKKHKEFARKMHISNGTMSG